MILGLAFYFVVIHWQKTQAHPQYNQQLLFDTILSYPNIALLLSLTVINWMLEGIKWKLAVSKLSEINLSESIKQILTAHIGGLITPAKLGDFTTKALYYPKENYKKVLWLSFLCSWFQMLATVMAALVGVGYMIYLYLPSYLPGYLLLLLLVLFCWKYIPRLIRGSQPINHSKIYRTYQRSFLIKPTFGYALWGWSLLRYIVFAHQFYFLMLLFEVGLSYPHALALISCIYFFSSVVPVIQFFDVLLKSSLTVIVFGYFDIDQSSGLLIPFIMWLFNVVLPIIPGAYFLMRFQPKHKSAIKWS